MAVPVLPSDGDRADKYPLVGHAHAFRLDERSFNAHIHVDGENRLAPGDRVNIHEIADSHSVCQG